MPEPTVEDAKKLAQKYGKDGVIIFHFKFHRADKEGGWGYASYGKNKNLCKRVKRLADLMADAVFGKDK